MSQFTDSLRKKAQELSDERATIQARLTADAARLTDLNSAITGIEVLLKVEGASVPPPSKPVQGSFPTLTSMRQPPLDAPPLKAVLKDVLADGRPHEVQELIGAAQHRGIEFGEKDPFKTVNFTLMGIATGKKIQRLQGDTWQQVG
jgi:hypothetical protein